MKFHMKKRNILLILLIMLSFCLFSQFAFAEGNDTLIKDVCNNYDSDSGVIEVSNNEYQDLNKISNDNSLEDSSNSKNTTLFIVSDNPGTNILDKAGGELSDENKLNNVNLVVRSGEQIKTMNESELNYMLSSCDGFIGEWISSDVDSVLTSILGKNPSLSDKKLFLILQPPSGNLNSDSTSINLLRNNTLNYNKIFSSYTKEE